MARSRYAAIRAAFEVLWASRLTALIRAASKARGVIFTLHRVLPEEPAEFAPNAILQVRPDFLDYAIQRIRELGYDIVSLDEAVRRLESAAPARRFAVLTFDDAYRDNLVHALPVLRRHATPFTLYVPTAFVDGAGEIWWQALEDIVAGQEAIDLPGGSGAASLSTRTLEEKQAAYGQLYARMRAMPEPERVALIRDLAARYGYDLAGQCRSLIMDWDELRGVADDPLCTIGAHTVHHYELAKLPAAEARNEIARSVRVLEDRLGRRPVHLSYPIGGPEAAGPREFAMARELGLRTAVTTVPGALYAWDRDRLMSLPRISFNGLYQARRYVDVFAAPAIFSLGRRRRRVMAAPSSV